MTIQPDNQIPAVLHPAWCVPNAHDYVGPTECWHRWWAAVPTLHGERSSRHREELDATAPPAGADVRQAGTGQSPVTGVDERSTPAGDDRAAPALRPVQGR